MAKCKPTMKVETVPIGSVQFDPANVRKHPERNLDAIKGSLARFGQVKPVVVDENGIVRAGNGTLAAAKELGWESIAIVRTALRGSEATAYAVADNRTAELATWDDQALADTLKSLEDEGFPLGEIGYDVAELDQLLDGLGRSDSEQVRDAEDTYTPDDPQTTWTLIGIACDRFGEIRPTIDRLAAIDGVSIETVNDGQRPDQAG